MKIVITGGAGFLGARLARTLLNLEQQSTADIGQSANLSIILVDRVAPSGIWALDSRLSSISGDLNDLLVGGQAIAQDADVVVHLAAAVSAECEADFDLGMRSNYHATYGLLEACRRLKNPPRLVYASSLAVFGGTQQQPLPDTIQDNTLPTPQGSYGIQKFIGEQLVADYTRKGFVRGRSVRPMTVSVRPGLPNGAASGFLSGMIREPLAGVRSTVPVAPSTAVALASPGRTVEGLMCAIFATDEAWGPRTAVTLPGIKTTVGEMAQALENVAGKAAASLLDWQPSPAIEKLVGSWPANINAERARSLGLLPDTSFEQIIRDYISENPQAVSTELGA